MAGTPSSSRGSGLPTTGGTLTGPLTVDSGVDQAQLVVEATSPGDFTVVKVNQGGATPGAFIDVYDASTYLAVGTYQAAAGTAGRAAISASDDGAAGQATVAVQDDTGNQAVIIKGGLTQELLQVFTDGLSRLRINPNGYLVVQRIAAPADGDLSANEVALWYDPDNTTPALKIKAKKANGGVVTGTVLLS